MNELLLSDLMRVQRKLRNAGLKGHFSYHGFFNNGELTHIFVSHEKVDFYGIERLKITNKNERNTNFEVPTTMKLVKGFLYDVKNGHFVTVYRLDDKQAKRMTDLFDIPQEYLFVIYDNGVPNVIIDLKNKIYSIICQYSTGLYTAIECFGIPTLISHISSSKKLTRVIFMNHPDWKSGGKIHCLGIVLDYTNKVIKMTNEIRFDEVIYAVDEIVSNRNYLNVLYGNAKINNYSRKSNISLALNSYDIPRVFYLHGPDLIIYRSSRGTYGDFLIFAPSFMKRFDMDLSFFGFRREESSFDKISFMIEKEINDFENEVYLVIFNETTMTSLKVKVGETTSYLYNYR